MMASGRNPAGTLAAGGTVLMSGMIGLTTGGGGDVKPVGARRLGLEGALLTRLEARR